MTTHTPIFALLAVAAVLFFGWALGRAIDHEARTHMPNSPYTQQP
jgi:hypothetical protein